METRTKKTEGLSAIIDREDTILPVVREIETRIEKIERENANIYIGTTGIVVKTYLSEYRFSNLREASEIFPELVAKIYA